MERFVPMETTSSRRSLAYSSRRIAVDEKRNAREEPAEGPGNEGDARKRKNIVGRRGGGVRKRVYTKKEEDSNHRGTTRPRLKV